MKKAMFLFSVVVFMAACNNTGDPGDGDDSTGGRQQVDTVTVSPQIDTATSIEFEYLPSADGDTVYKIKARSY